ncbi:MAG: hypothetical protein ACR2KE_03265 [Candidatus Nanopelagicales bacterium]
MKSSLKRLLGAAGATAVVAGIALVPATAAHADGTYYGAWSLEAFKINKTTIKCPGSLPVPPPAPPVSCKAGQYLELNTDYTYKTNLQIFSSRNLDKGDFATLKIGNSPHQSIVFVANGADNDPRAYQVKFSGMSSGMPTKMVIFTGMEDRDGKTTTVKMVFRRDPS